MPEKTSEHMSRPINYMMLALCSETLVISDHHLGPLTLLSKPKVWLALPDLLLSK